MSNFDDWYESYERDGGELMLYNTIDLQAAYEAGFEDGAKQATSKIRQVKNERN